MRIILNILLILLLGCAGGSRGTGGQRIEGVVLINNQKVSLSAGSGINVTILENGDGASTDQNGNFLIETSGISGDFTFLLERQDFQVQSIVTGFEPNPSELKVRVVVTLGNKPSAQTSIVTSKPTSPDDSREDDKSDDDSQNDDGDDSKDDDSGDDSKNDDDSQKDDSDDDSDDSDSDDNGDDDSGDDSDDDDGDDDDGDDDDD